MDSEFSTSKIPIIFCIYIIFILYYILLLTEPTLYVCSWRDKKYQYICPPPLPKSKNDREEIAYETEGARQHDIEFIPFDDNADLTGALTGRLTKIDKADSTGALTGDDYDQSHAPRGLNPARF